MSFSENRCAYCPRPSFSSQWAISASPRARLTFGLLDPPDG